MSESNRPELPQRSDAEVVAAMVTQVGGAFSKEVAAARIAEAEADKEHAVTDRTRLSESGRTNRWAIVIVGILGLALAVVTAVALLKDKEGFAMEVVKMAGAAFGGGGVGYAIGQKTREKKSE